MLQSYCTHNSSRAQNQTSTVRITRSSQQSGACSHPEKSGCSNIFGLLLSLSFSRFWMIFVLFCKRAVKRDVNNTGWTNTAVLFPGSQPGLPLSLRNSLGICLVTARMTFGEVLQLRGKNLYGSGQAQLYRVTEVKYWHHRRDPTDKHYRTDTWWHKNVVRSSLGSGGRRLAGRRGVVAQ